MDLSTVIVGQKIQEHMNKIKSMFKSGAEVTVLIRMPDKPEQDFLITNDNLDDIISAIKRSKERSKY